MKNQASFLLLSRNFESCYMSKKENLRSLLAIKSDSGHISESVQRFIEREKEREIDTYEIIIKPENILIRKDMNMM